MKIFHLRSPRLNILKKSSPPPQQGCDDTEKKPGRVVAGSRVDHHEEPTEGSTERDSSFGSFGSLPSPGTKFFLRKRAAATHTHPSMATVPTSSRLSSPRQGATTSSTSSLPRTPSSAPPASTRKRAPNLSTSSLPPPSSAPPSSTRKRAANVSASSLPPPPKSSILRKKAYASSSSLPPPPPPACTPPSSDCWDCQKKPPPSPSAFAAVGDNNNEDEDEPTELPKKKPAKKMVRFPSRGKKLEQMKQISRLSSKALTEIKAVWGNKCDQAKRKQQLKKDIKLYKEGRRNSDNETFTTVGIEEYLTSEKRMQQRNTRKEAVLTVMTKLQEYGLDEKNSWHSRNSSQNHSSNDSIEEDVAEAYRDVTEESKYKAHRDALHLHQSIHSEPVSIKDNRFASFRIPRRGGRAKGRWNRR